MDGIVCVLDADQVFAYPEYPALLDLKLGQVGFADMLVLNKVNLAGPDQMDAVRGWLDAHFNRLRVVETSQCQVPLPLIFGVGASQHGHQNPTTQTVTMNSRTIPGRSAHGATKARCRCRWPVSGPRCARSTDRCSASRESCSLRTTPTSGASCR